MKKIITMVLTFTLIFSLSACGDSGKHEGEAKTPSASEAQKGRDYKMVIEDFEEQGFKNVKTKPLDDLITGWMTKDGEVESVSVDGNEEYSPDRWYANDVEVLITYHTFPEDETKEDSDENVVEADTESNYNKSKSDEASETTSNEADSTIITEKNNPEFAAVLMTQNELDPVVKEFADKYSLRTIEFDGYISDVTQFKDYETRLNVLVFVGDYRTENLYGPNIQLENIGTVEYDWVKDAINQNVHVTAKVMEYRESSGLLILNPISIEKR